MKRILSLLLAVMMLVSAVPAAYATNIYQSGDTESATTQVVYTADNNEDWTVTVPAKLKPGQSGTVTLAGSWPADKTVSVTADKDVVLVNSLLSTDTKTLKITFGGISEVGNNIAEQTFTATISVEEMANGLFGVWSGKFNYNVNTAVNNTQEMPKFQLLHKPTNITTNITQTFDVYGCDIVGEPVTSPTSTTITYKGNEHYACISNLTIPVTEIITDDFYVLDYGEFGIVPMDIKTLNMTAEELSSYSVIIVWPDYHVAETNIAKTEINFTMEDYTINSETISVPCITYTHYFPDGSSSSGSPRAEWIYDETTKTFTMGTPDTVITQGMKIYIDAGNVLLNVVNGISE